MAVRLVTDSTSDLPAEVAGGLGIVVVPLSINFGDEVYLDGVDLTADEFFYKLEHSPSLPTTSQPSAGAFAQVYSDLACETSEVISIHISAKLSGTCNSALLGREAVKRRCRIEIIDSLQASMGLGLLAIVAARAAQAGADLDQVINTVNQTIPRTHFFGMVDTLEYLAKGGRIGKAQALMGALLNIKPLIGLRDGETHPWGRVRSRRRALERLVGLVSEFERIEELAIIPSTDLEEAEVFLERLSPMFPKERVYRARFGPVMGTYMGPGTLAVALIGGIP